MKKINIFIVLPVLILCLCSSAKAVPTVDNFSITLETNNHFVTGDGSGYNDGTGMVDPATGNATPWYYYPNTYWYNQWFYDNPPDPTRWKEITYDIDITGVGNVTVVINWSTLDFPESGRDGEPPIPPLALDDELSWISRDYVVYNDYIEATAAPQKFTGTVIIPDYNPEWVSIDVMAGAETPITVSGIITHECIPAPGAILLGSIGVGLVGWLRKRRTL